MPSQLRARVSWGLLAFDAFGLLFSVRWRGRGAGRSHRCAGKATGRERRISDVESSIIPAGTKFDRG